MWLGRVIWSTCYQHDSLVNYGSTIAPPPPPPPRSLECAFPTFYSSPNVEINHLLQPALEPCCGANMWQCCCLIPPMWRFVSGDCCKLRPPINPFMLHLRPRVYSLLPDILPLNCTNHAVTTTGRDLIDLNYTCMAESWCLSLFHVLSYTGSNVNHVLNVNSWMGCPEYFILLHTRRKKNIKNPDVGRWYLFTLHVEQHIFLSSAIRIRNGFYFAT